MIPPHYFFIALGISEIALAFFKRARSGANNRDRGSLFALWGVIGLCIYLAIRFTYTQPRFAWSYSPGWYIAAIALFLSGSALRWWSIIHLGRFFTVNVAIAADHCVVDDGPYRHIRHPSYTGVLLAFIGPGVMLFNWLSLLVLVVPIFAMFAWRMVIEERALRQALGRPYEEYMERTKRLVPWLL